MASIADLDALSKSIPGLNQKAAKQQQAAQRIQAKTAVGQAPGNVSTRQVAQSVAAPLAQSQSQAGLQAQQQTQQSLGQLAQRRVQEQGFQGQQALGRQAMAQQSELGAAQRKSSSDLSRAGLAAERELTSQELQQAKDLQQYGITQENQALQLSANMRKDLNDLGNDLEGELFDSRRRFDEDERGRKFTNARQLADYALANARTQQEFQANMQSIQEAQQKKILLIQAAHNRITETLSSEAAIKEADLNAEQKIELANYAAAMNRQLAREQATASSINNILTGGGTILGGILGSTVAPGVGTVGGASLGAAAGGMLGGALSGGSPF